MIKIIRFDELEYGKSFTYPKGSTVMTKKSASSASKPDGSSIRLGPSELIEVEVFEEISLKQKVYVALLQPDGDWDHLADILGVFSTTEKAQKRIKGWGKDAVVVEFELDAVIPKFATEDMTGKS